VYGIETKDTGSKDH